MLIESLERKIALYAIDAAAVQSQTMQTIQVDLSGRHIVGPDAVGDALRGLVKSTKEEVRTGNRMIERGVGRFAGFELGIAATRGEEVPTLYLSGRCVYNVEPYQTGPALVSGLLAALDLVAKHHAEASSQLEVRRKRLGDLRLELARPFEHENRLLMLMARQRELLKCLDLDKDEAGTGRAETDEVRLAA